MWEKKENEKRPIQESQIILQMSEEFCVAWEEHPSHLNKSMPSEYLDFRAQ